MEIILLERVKHLGQPGDQVAVKPGFGRNYLIPHGKAVPATKDNIARFEARRAELQQEAQQTLTAAQARAEKLTGLKIGIAAQADQEKLYGSIGTKEIVDAVADAGHEIHKNEVLLPDGVIRHTGEYSVSLQLHSDVTAKIELSVTAADEN